MASSQSQTVIESLEHDITELNKAVDDEWHRGEMMTGLFISAVGLILGHVRPKGLECHHVWMPLVLSFVVAVPFALMFLKRVYRITMLKEKLGHKKERLQHFKKANPSASSEQAPDLEQQYRQGEETFEAGLQGKCMICNWEAIATVVYFFIFLGVIGLISYGLACGFKKAK